MKHLIFIIFILSHFYLSSCASTTQSTLLGASIGASTGAITGGITKKDHKGSLLGALFFGLMGGLSGYWGHKALEKRDEKVRKESVFQLENYLLDHPRSLDQ